MPLDEVAAAIEDFRDGKMVIVIDEEDRENEGDLTIAAEKSDSRGHQLHGQIWTGVDLYAHDGRAVARVEHTFDGVQE